MSSVLLIAQDAAVSVGVNLTDTNPFKQSKSWQEATLNTLQNAGGSDFGIPVQLEEWTSSPAIERLETFLASIAK